jgi:hypothetical protein
MIIIHFKGNIVFISYSYGCRKAFFCFIVAKMDISSQFTKHLELFFRPKNFYFLQPCLIILPTR